jgi:hypothetical protein
MEQCEIERAISCLKLAIELAGDGGMTPFTDVEYKLMYQLLDELSTNDEANTSINNNTVVVVSEDDDFFADDYEDYKKIMGKCFINERIGIAVKILEIPNDEYYNLEPYEFIYERCDNWIDGWNFETHNWLQEQTQDKYNEFKITPYANMNIASEYMFHLGKNGKLYTSVACDDDYYEFTEITADEFEKIRNEAIEKKRYRRLI